MFDLERDSTIDASIMVLAALSVKAPYPLGIPRSTLIATAGTQEWALNLGFFRAGVPFCVPLVASVTLRDAERVGN